ncbi:hypothetical protein RZS08_57670, partial [Arthrospira platensis SPKY1]|nr:hypothetical protein [Arthrospira platensis SPKY1]
MSKNTYTGFSARHLGPGPDDVADMLRTIGVDSLDTLIDQTVPRNIRRKGRLDLPEALSEYDYLRHARALGAQNKVFRNFIG